MLEFIKPFRPIVWPSASLQQEALGLSPSHVKAINRALIEAGLITMVHELTGRPAVVAFDSGNLMPVAKAIRAEIQTDRSCLWPTTTTTCRGGVRRYRTLVSRRRMRPRER